VLWGELGGVLCANTEAHKAKKAPTADVFKIKLFITCSLQTHGRIEQERSAHSL
jgi:hypothetical protein